MSDLHQFDSGREHSEGDTAQGAPFDCLRETIHILGQNTRQNRRLPIRFVMLSTTIDANVIDTSSII